MKNKLATTILSLYISKVIRQFAIGLLDLSKTLTRLSKISSKEKKILERNIIFKDLHQGNRAFVIVNGPSLNKQDLSILKNEITFTVSGFWKHSIIHEWQPTYYCLSDPTFFKGGENITDFFKNLNSRVTESIFFIPLFRGYDANMKYKLLPNTKTYYIASYGSPSANLDVTNLIQGFQSVSAFALALAIYMGCSPIYLLGFDHDYLSHRGIDHHFYDGSAIEGHRTAFIPLSQLNTYDGEMRDMLKLWQNYRSLKEIALKKNIQIVNVSENSFLDVFEKDSFSKIINK